jgi:hypothetical protein
MEIPAILILPLREISSGIKQPIILEVSMILLACLTEELHGHRLNFSNVAVSGLKIIKKYAAREVIRS